MSEGDLPRPFKAFDRGKRDPASIAHLRLGIVVPPSYFLNAFANACISLSNENVEKKSDNSITLSMANFIVFYAFFG